MDLFADVEDRDQPLAYRMRPRNLDEYVGQDHIIGPGRLLRRVIQADRLSSLIFYGPPGTGKTTLARVIANTTRSDFVTLNAVLSGVKELRAAIAEAGEKRSLYGSRTILFVDEVHRWNKAQQDALLPWVENGTVILIGATTENPFFEVNKALVSRSRIFQLKALEEADLRGILRQALDDPLRGYGRYRVELEPEARDHLVSVAAGDARSLLNALELAVETTPESFPPPEGTTIRVDLTAAEESIQKKALLYDKEGDYHFDTISAFIKSIRGSDPDGTLYWLALMVRAGEEPRYIFRRLLISASEDIGLADPRALGVVESAAAAFDRVGLPEGRYHLAQAALYLATAPKSNSALGFFDALEVVEREAAAEVPNHLRDSSRDKHGFGHGEGYLYPHAYREHWVAQQYLPTGLQGRVFYQPGTEGYEAEAGRQVERRRELQLALSDEGVSEEVLTFSPPDKKREAWLRRQNDARGRTLETLRERAAAAAGMARHHRVLVAEGGAPLLLWEALRRAPEGLTAALLRRERDRENSRHLVQRLPEPERPRILAVDDCCGLPPVYRDLGIDEGLRYDIFMALNPFRQPPEEAFWDGLRGVLAPSARVVLVQNLPGSGTRLSEVIPPDFLSASERRLFLQVEAALFADAARPLLSWEPGGFLQGAAECGFRLESGTEDLFEEVSPGAELWEQWLDPANSRGYGGRLEALGADRPEIDLPALRSRLKAELSGSPLAWRRTYLFVTGTFERDPVYVLTKKEI